MVIKPMASSANMATRPGISGIGDLCSNASVSVLSRWEVVECQVMMEPFSDPGMMMMGSSAYVCMHVYVHVYARS